MNISVNKFTNGVYKASTQVVEYARKNPAKTATAAVAIAILGSVPYMGLTVPNVGLTVPNAGLNVPNAGLTVPNAGLNVPNAGLNVPNAGLNATPERRLDLLAIKIFGSLVFGQVALLGLVFSH